MKAGTALPWVAGTLIGVIAVGRAWAPGYLLHLDMVTVPNPPLTGALFGLDAELPRAVPSDLVLALLSRLAPGGLAIKLLLVAAFAIGCAGTARLLPAASTTASTAASTAAGVLYAWNPWTAERLAMGHWPLLLSYAGLPWVAAATRRLSTEPRAVAGLVVALLLPAVGGISGCLLAAVLVAAVLAATRAGRAQWLIGTAAVLLVSLPWLLPSVLRSTAATVDPAGVDAFALRPDGPFGPVGTALQLAGVWNRLAVPAGRGALLVQVAALAVTALAAWGLRRTPGAAGIALAGGVGLLLALAPTITAGADLLKAAGPATGIMRDSHRWLALLALPIAVGAGTAVGKIPRHAAVLAILTPPALLPALAGQLHAAHYPPDWIRVQAAVRADPGPVLALPWTPFRDYDWAPGIALTPATKIFPAPVRWNDTVIVGGTTIAAEDPATRDLTRIIEAGPTGERLRQYGIRYVLVETDQQPRTRIDGLKTVVTGEDLTLYRVDGQLTPQPPPVRAPAAIVAADLAVTVTILWCTFLLLTGKLRTANVHRDE